ncbi:MAG: ABC transporter permease [Chloroflexota bacterium]
MSLQLEFRRILTNPPLIAGILAVAVLIAIGASGAALAPYDPNATAQLVWHTAPDGSRVYELPPTMPATEHWLGTDALGRDQWSRILGGAWLTLSVVIVSTLMRFVLGVSIGIVSGWYGGVIARVVRVVSRGVTALPQLLLAILLVIATRPLGLVGFIGSLALVGWPEIAEYINGEARRARSKPYIEAARSLGATDRRIVRSHLITTLAPQLLTLGALETGSVLLLLAELGIVGLFVAGSTFLVGEFGRLSPLMGRTPEWGQMLGAIQFYAIDQQLATLLPALFIVLAAASFTLLADGLRAASDPFSTQLLRPATFSVLAKVLTGALCFSAVGFIGANVYSRPLTMEQGRVAATATAERTWPGSVLVAGVARYVSPRSFERPDRLTYYFRNERNEVLRISYSNADRLAAEVRPYELEDDLDFASLRPLPAGLASYEQPAAFANEHRGGELRAGSLGSIYRAIVSWPPDRTGPVYTVIIGRPRLLTLWLFCCFDGKTAATEPGAAWFAR